ncbi:Hypothetical predicted protein [Olea europaea subsp. europaea]|uniref:Uncharacterized protein n=1 Tax=Olea europaea subsp. europaea TaxID=158383 RepID=A0A8S0SLQ7_OLEEU|nr:Hypothetical predicted protein [Olea europaea subsp. europaea]
MDFEYLVPKNARLRANISQRSNLRYVKTVLEHFDDRQRTDFLNSCLGFLSEIWAFEAMPEIGDRFARRLGHQSPRLLSWTCTKQPQQRTYDAFFKNIKVLDCVSCTRFACVVTRYIFGDTQFLYVAAARVRDASSHRS